jgi:hypothetical protein
MSTGTGRWILDLVVKDAALDPQVQSISTLIWLILNVDGLAQPFSTPTASVSAGLSWDFPARLFLSLSDVAGAYLYVTMCTFGPNNQGLVTIARSRIGLRSLPRDSPKTFRFPLMRSQNGAQEFARLCVCATLSAMAGPQSYTGASPGTSPFLPRSLQSV